MAAGARFIPGNPSVVMSGVALGIAGAGYATVHGATPGSLDSTDGRAHEDVSRTISAPKAAVAGAVTTGLLIAAGHGEAKLSAGFARAAAAVLGGNAADHRTAGRLASFATIAAAGWGAVTLVNRKLAVGGSAPDNANLSAPELSEVTGGPGSLIPWEKQSREASRWLREVLRPGRSPRSCRSPPSSPSGSTRPWPVPRPRPSGPTCCSPRSTAPAPWTGRCSRCSPHRFGLRQLRGDRDAGVPDPRRLRLGLHPVLGAALGAVTQPRPHGHPADPHGRQRHRRTTAGACAGEAPKFVLFGESLGSQVSQEMFRGQGITGPAGISLDAAVWIGTPNATKWRAELWGDRTVSQVPPVGPGAVYLSRAVRDWRRLSPNSVPGSATCCCRTAMTRSRNSARRSCGASPTGWGRRRTSARLAARFAVATGGHLLRDLPGHAERPDPTPGQFDEGGHDYRRETPEAVRQVFGLQASDEQMQRVQKSLRERELRFEIQRDWDAAQSAPRDKRAEAEEKVEAHLRLDRARGGRRGDQRSLRSRREPRAGSVQHPAWPSLRRRSVRMVPVRRRQIRATVSAAMMSQMPHHAATSAIPPRPSKKLKTSSSPSPAFRTPTSNVIAFCCGTGNLNAGDAVAEAQGQSVVDRDGDRDHADPGHEQRPVAQQRDQDQAAERGEGDRTHDLRALGRELGKKCPTVMPTANGTPMTSNTSLSMSIAFRSIDRMISEPVGCNPPHSAKFNGIRKIARRLPTAVIDTDKATSPRTGASRCWTRCPAGSRPPGSFPAPPIPARRGSA